MISHISPTKLRRVLLFVLPVVVAIVVAVIASDDDPQRTVDIAADEATFTSLAELTKASDLVVVARATATTPGRVVSATGDPATAVKTQLVTLEVGDVLAGNAGSTLLLEQESELADGTPITVNGVTQLVVGDEGVFFLVANKDPSTPYVALTNRQGRFLVAGPARDLLATTSDDRLTVILANLGPYELRCQVLALNDPSRKCAGPPLPTS